MKKATTLLATSIAICLIYPIMHAAEEEIYEITAPQELSSFQNEWYFAIKWLMTGSGITIWKWHSSPHSGKFLCLAPKKNGTQFATQVVASFPWRTPILYGNFFDTREKTDPQQRPWMSLMSGKINNEHTSGKIFSFSANPRFGVPSECSYPGNSIPSNDTSTVTYKIRLQFQPNTKLAFNKYVGGKKTWLLGLQNYSKSMNMLYSGLPDYGVNSEWTAASIIAKQLDGTVIDISKSYLDSIESSEGFEIPGNTEILTLTYTR